MIAINTQPPAFNYINSSIRLTATMTDIISGNITRSLVYCIIDGTSSAEITPRFRYDPTEGVPFNLFFQQDISNILFTPKPPVAVFTGSVDVPSMVKTLKIKLIEISFDSEECTSTETATVTSNPFVVVNSAKSFQNYYTEGTPNVILAAPKPTILKRHKGYPELLYTITSGPASVTISRYYYDSNNDEISNDTSTYSTTEYVTLFNVMPSSLASNVRRIGVAIGVTGGLTPTQYLLDIIPDCPLSCQVSYISRQGGYSTLSGKKTASSPSTNNEFIYRNLEPNGLGGNMTSNKESYMEVEVTIPFVIVKDSDILVYEDFIASGHYYVASKGPDGQLRQISHTASSFTLDKVLGIVKCKLRPYLPSDQPNYYL